MVANLLITMAIFQTDSKNLVDYIPLSLEAIEKRKRNRKIFEIEESGDKPILDKAIEYGFL